MSAPIIGASWIPQIKDAWTALIASHRTSLERALKLGEILLRAKETVNGGNTKGPWTNWLEVHVPEVSHRTANIYMSLAAPDARAAIDEAYSQHAATKGASGDLSIRAALEAVAQARRGDKPKKTPRKKRPLAVVNGGVTNPEDETSGAKTDPVAIIADLAADDIVNNIEDADKRIDVLLALLQGLEPDEIVAVVLATIKESAKAKKVGEDIARQAQSPPQNRPQIRMRRVIEPAGAALT